MTNLPPLEYTPVDGIWARWMTRKLKDRRDRMTLAENGFRFFEAEDAPAQTVDWDTVTVAEVIDGH